MNLVPLFYILVFLVIFVALLRLRKIAITSTKNAPRRHRTTYRQVKL